MTLRAPRMPVYSNVTAAPFPDDAAGIASLLARQLTESVMWEASLGAMLAAGKGEGGEGVTESVMGRKLTESVEGNRAGLSGLSLPVLLSSLPRQEAAV